MGFGGGFADSIGLSEGHLFGNSEKIVHEWNLIKNNYQISTKYQLNLPQLI
jgi:hypothetical protein